MRESPHTTRYTTNKADERSTPNDTSAAKARLQETKYIARKIQNIYQKILHRCHRCDTQRPVNSVQKLMSPIRKTAQRVRFALRANVLPDGMR